MAFVIVTEQIKLAPGCSAVPTFGIRESKKNNNHHHEKWHASMTLQVINI